MDTISTLPPPSTPPPPQAPPPQVPPTRHSWLDVPIARDRDHRKIGGVIAGISAAYGFDRRTTRIAVAIGALVVPGLVALYIAAMIFLPREASGAMSLRQIVSDRRRRPLMIALGIAAVATGFGSWSFFGGVGWGFALVAAGVLLWLMPNLGNFDDTERSSGVPLTGVAAPLDATTHTGSPVGATTGSLTRSRRRRHPIQAIGLAAASFGVLVAGVGNSAEWWDVTTYGVLLGALITLVVATVVGAIVNHSWFGIPMLFVLGAATFGLVVTHPNLDGGLGDRTYRPTTLADADDDHQLGVGRLTLDLRDVPFGEQPLSISAGVGFGQLRVMVPDDVEVVLSSDLNAGHVLVNGDEVFDGLRRDDTLTVPARGEGAHHTLVLDASIGAGELDVRQAG